MHHDFEEFLDSWEVKYNSYPGIGMNTSRGHLLFVVRKCKKCGYQLESGNEYKTCEEYLMNKVLVNE